MAPTLVAHFTKPKLEFSLLTLRLYTLSVSEISLRDWKCELVIESVNSLYTVTLVGGSTAALSCILEGHFFPLEKLQLRDAN